MATVNPFPATAVKLAAGLSLYQGSPEYQQINIDMELAGFKLIFFWEYVHRVWGRLLGPLVFHIVLADEADSQGYGYHFLGLLALGGFRELLAGGWLLLVWLIIRLSHNTGWQPILAWRSSFLCCCCGPP